MVEDAEKRLKDKETEGMKAKEEHDKVLESLSKQ